MSQKVALHQSKPETTPRQAQMAEEDGKQLKQRENGFSLVCFWKVKRVAGIIEMTFTLNLYHALKNVSVQVT